MRILITGASGLLGSNLVLAGMDAGHEVIACSNTQAIRLPAVETHQTDLTSPATAGELLESTRPDWVLHCAGATDVDRCELDPAWAMNLNIDMAANVASAAAAARASLVHISTDAVFDGSAGSYRETEVPQPINVYGESKMDGEQAVIEAHPEAAVVRTNFFGWSPPGRRSLAEWFLDNLRAGEACDGFSDVWTTPLLTNHLAHALLRILEAGISGLYHVGSRGPVSKYAFGVNLAEAFGLDPSLIRRTEVGTAGLRAPRPKNISLNSEKVERALGVEQPETLKGIDTLRELEREGYRERLSGVLLETAQS